jgi:hypothetical protein
MSQPPAPYDRSWSFTDFSQSNPTTPHQGQKIDQELNNVQDSLNDTISRLGEIQADDGFVRTTALNLPAIAEEVEPLLTDAPVQAVEAAGAQQVGLVNDAGDAKVAELEAVLSSQNAIDAINARDDAEIAKDIAESSAILAQGYAGTAQGYANTALQAKNSAQVHAQVAVDAAASIPVIQGPPGPQGQQGNPGVAGQQGIQGIQGVPGPAGSDANVTSTNVTNALGYTPANRAGDTFTNKVNFTSVGGAAGLNVGIGGSSASATVNGDIWIPTAGTNLNFRDGNGIARVCASTTSGNTFNQPQIVDTSNTLPALRVTQRGTGNALVVEDSTSPDATPTIIDAAGNVAIGAADSNGYKLRVNGSAQFSSVLSTVISTSSITLNGQSIGQAVAGFLFGSGDVLYSGNKDIDASISYFDGTDWFYSGNSDSNGNTIGTPSIGYTPYDITWNLASSSFVVTDGTSQYDPSGTQVGDTFYTNMQGTVTVYSDGAGGVTYSPPSQA